MDAKDKSELKEIINLINKNTVDAWEDNLNSTSPVVILDNFDKGADKPDVVVYNGWYEKLKNLLKK